MRHFNSTCVIESIWMINQPQIRCCNVSGSIYDLIACVDKLVSYCPNVSSDSLWNNATWNKTTNDHSVTGQQHKTEIMKQTTRDWNKIYYDFVWFVSTMSPCKFCIVSSFFGSFSCITYDALLSHACLLISAAEWSK